MFVLGGYHFPLGLKQKIKQTQGKADNFAAPCHPILTHAQALHHPETGLVDCVLAPEMVREAPLCPRFFDRLALLSSRKQLPMDWNVDCKFASKCKKIERTGTSSCSMPSFLETLLFVLFGVVLLQAARSICVRYDFCALGSALACFSVYRSIAELNKNRNTDSLEQNTIAYILMLGNAAPRFCRSRVLITHAWRAIQKVMATM